MDAVPSTHGHLPLNAALRVSWDYEIVSDIYVGQGCTSLGDIERKKAYFVAMGSYETETRSTPRHERAGAAKP